MAESPEIAWTSLGFRDLFSVLLPYLWPFVAGTVVIGGIAAVLSYFLFFWLVRRYRREQKAVGQGAPPV
jgi:uncharacterized protein (DUF2062 family)